MSKLCPVCGSDGYYEGFHLVECRNRSCKHFTERALKLYMDEAMSSRVDTEPMYTLPDKWKLWLGVDMPRTLAAQVAVVTKALAWDLISSGQAQELLSGPSPLGEQPPSTFDTRVAALRSGTAVLRIDWSARRYDCQYVSPSAPVPVDGADPIQPVWLNPQAKHSKFVLTNPTAPCYADGTEVRMGDAVRITDGAAAYRGLVLSWGAQVEVRHFDADYPTTHWPSAMLTPIHDPDALAKTLRAGDELVRTGSSWLLGQEHLRCNAEIATWLRNGARIVRREQKA